MSDRLDLERIRDEVRRRADAMGEDGWMSLPVPTQVTPSGVLRVPRAPFELWAVHRSHAAHLVAPWTPVSPRGLKMGGDDPFHTDWMLGAGLGLDDMRAGGGNPHHEMLSAAAYAGMAEVQERLLGFAAAVLLPGPRVRGRVVHGASGLDSLDGREPPVLVLADLRPDRLDSVRAVLDLGGAVLAERGGETAHLVSVLRGEEVGPILRVPDARRRFPPGALADVVPAEGVVELAEDGIGPNPPRSLFTISDLAKAAPPPAAPRPAASSGGHGRFGLVVHPAQARPDHRFDRMEPAAKVVGRDWQAYASFQWSDGHSPLSQGQPRHLVVHVRRRDGRAGSGFTVVSPARVWAPSEAVRACGEALVLCAPSEAWDSPETQAVRRESEERAHGWWRERSGYNRASDDELVEAARRTIREHDELRREVADQGLGRQAMGTGLDEETLDALEAHRHSERRFDVEFERRGMPERCGRLRAEMDEEMGPGGAMPCP